MTVQQFDPTRTLTLRTKFATEVRRRFAVIQQAVTTKIVGEQFFSPTTLTFNVAGEYLLDPQKILAFMAWFQKQTDTHILELNQQTSPLAPPIFQGFHIQSWGNVYLDLAYMKGLERAELELHHAGQRNFVMYRDQPGGVMATFHNPITTDRLGALYSRTFTSIQGITIDLNIRVSNILSLGLSAGINPRDLAAQLVKEIGMAEKRAEKIVRTEVVRAHHKGMIQSYRNLGVFGVQILAEFRTAGDDRVCNACHNFEGQIFTLDEAENLIPIHLGCRCMCLPIASSGSLAEQQIFARDLTGLPSVVEY